jgi:hypothetical protein
MRNIHSIPLCINSDPRRKPGAYGTIICSCLWMLGSDTRAQAVVLYTRFHVDSSHVALQLGLSRDVSLVDVKL